MDLDGFSGGTHCHKAYKYWWRKRRESRAVRDAEQKVLNCVQ